MNGHIVSQTPENTRPNGSGVSQMTAEQHSLYLPTLAHWQANPAAFAQVVQNFFQQQSVGASAAGANASSGTNFAFAADLNRLSYTSAIPPSPDFDAVVASRLRQADKGGRSYKDALREMHAVFNYPSNLWIDYYLDRRVAITGLIDESERCTPVKLVKKPGIDRTASVTASTSAPAARLGSAYMKKGPASGFLADKPRRATLNSMAAFYDLTPDFKDDVIPAPPSREPIPPTEVQTMGLRGNAFTKADIKYLVDFVNWVCAHKDWSVTRMYMKLHKRAPHHTAASWAGKAKTIPIIAKIIDASARDEEGVEEEDSYYRGIDVDDPTDARHSSSGRRRRQVGGTGTAITDGDLKKMANWIVENGDEWEEMSGKMRWFSFAEKYDKRSWQAWTEAYRRYQTEVDTLVNEMRLDGCREATS